MVNGSLFSPDQVEIDDSGAVIQDHLEMFEELHTEQAEYFHALIVLDMSQVDQVCIQMEIADGSQAKAVDSGLGGRGDGTGQASAAFDRIGSRIIAKISEVKHQARGAGIEDEEAGSGIRFRLDKDKVAYAGKGDDAGGGVAGDDRIDGYGEAVRYRVGRAAETTDGNNGRKQATLHGGKVRKFCVLSGFLLYQPGHHDDKDAEGGHDKKSPFQAGPLGNEADGGGNH